MIVRNNIVAPLIAVAIAGASLGGTFAVASFMQPRRSIAAPSVALAKAHPQQLANPLVATGHRLFLMNCAHCHADDARGDEGPDLHGLRKTDERLRLLIKNGIKGEMTLKLTGSISRSCGASA
jgi:mono/diheme cytochrome c family protein